MKIVYNNIIPFPGFSAINLFGILFVRKEFEGCLTKEVLNHELIHTTQMKEMLYIFFYFWYFTEWIIRIFVNGSREAYKNISFEREAFRNDHNLEYLKTRNYWSWIKYIILKIK